VILIGADRKTVINKAIKTLDRVLVFFVGFFVVVARIVQRCEFDIMMFKGKFWILILFEHKSFKITEIVFRFLQNLSILNEIFPYTAQMCHQIIFFQERH